MIFSLPARSSATRSSTDEGLTGLKLFQHALKIVGALPLPVPRVPLPPHLPFESPRLTLELPAPPLLLLRPGSFSFRADLPALSFPTQPLDLVPQLALSAQRPLCRRARDEARARELGGKATRLFRQ